ncbi:MAG: hypothetical protein ACQESH_00285 [Campylobacterota bacterium]
MPRLVKAPIEIEFDLFNSNQKVFEREYHSLTETDNDPVGQWIKLAKAKGETDVDEVLLKLIVELHRKVDKLTEIIKDEVPQKVKLSHHELIDSIGFEHFSFEKPILQKEGIYYGRVLMPIFPQKDVPVIFKAQSQTLAHIIKIHSGDEKEWAAYFTARERVMIREQKGSNDN